ncbi:MAG: type II toxin-antitoxin system PemK/MazF family toxin [bacterium]
MVKKRPVVVVSPKLKRFSRLCTVVCISTVEPDSPEPWHYKLPRASLPPDPTFQQSDSWVKGDMIYRVSFERLNLILLKNLPRTGGKRPYFKQRLGRDQMKSIYGCILQSLNLGELGQHL